MTKEQFEELKDIFPVKVKVTQEIIDEGSKELNNIGLCIGARTLHSILPKEHFPAAKKLTVFSSNSKYTWGTYSGTIMDYFYGEGRIGNYFEVCAKDNEGNFVDMMDIKKPTTVILDLYHEED